MLDIALAREALGFEASKDTTTQRLVAAVIALWESRTNRLWNLRAGFVYEVRPQRFATKLWVPLYPITSLVVKQRSDGDDTFDTLDADDIHVLTERGRVTLLSSTGVGTEWLDQVEFTISGGHDVENVPAPADVIEALLTQLTFSQQRNSGEKIAQSSQGFEGGSSSFLTPDVHPLFKATARAHRRRT